METYQLITFYFHLGMTDKAYCLTRDSHEQKPFATHTEGQQAQQKEELHVDSVTDLTK